MEQWRNTILPACHRARDIGLYGFLLFLPCSIAFSQMCLGLLALAFLVEAAVKKQFHLPRTPLNLPLLAYLASTVITTMFSVNVRKSIKGLDTLLIISVFYLFFYYMKDIEQIKRCAGLLVVFMTIAAFYGVLQHYLEVDLFRISRPISFLKHINDDLKAPVRVPGFFSIYMTFAGQLSMMLPVMCALLISVKSVPKKLLLTLSVVLTVFALFWTYTRSAWLGVICALMAAGFLKSKKLLLVVLLLVMLPGIFLLQPGRLGDGLSVLRDKDEERIYTWITTIDMIRDYPLTGIGKKNYSGMIDPYRERRYGDFEFSSDAHAHNNILHVTVDGGIFTGLCFLCLWWVIFREMYRTCRRVPEEDNVLKWLALGLFGAIVAFFVQGFFEHNWGDSESAMMMWVLIAFSLKLQALVPVTTKER